MNREDFKNFSDFFEYITELYGNNTAIHWKEKDKYEGLTGQKLKELTYLAANAFAKLGLRSGDKAAIISESRFEWAVTDFACISNGIVTVPIYTTMTSEQIKFILEHSEAKLCFVSTKLIADKVSAVFDELKNLTKIISFNKLENEPEYVISFEDLIYGELVHEKTPYSEQSADAFFSECAQKHHPDDLLTIIYTSGTTGNPKGVCLTHKNILANIKQSISAINVHDNDVILSFLPLAHSYERTAGYYLMLSRGVKIYYAQSIDTLQTQMQEVKPTVLLSVPILFSRIYGRVIKNIDAMSFFKKMIAKRALKFGKKYIDNKSHSLWKLSDKKVFSTIRNRTGGRLRLIVSGGSALSKELAEFYDSIGMPIMQGYGMTEASPVIAVNKPEKNKYGTVGRPLNGIDIKIADDGEILVHGDNLMQGYYKNSSETSETIKNGWLHTGDIGEIDSEGFLKITGRKKALIKTAGGKYISLTHIEDTLELSEYINQIIAVGSDDKDFITALIVPDFDKLKEFAQKVNVKYDNLNELVENEVINNFFESEIDVLQRPLAKYERVRKFALLDKPFTIESGDLTPTLKPKRNVIERNYKDIIDTFYKK